jgi:hypothetical protein
LIFLHACCFHLCFKKKNMELCKHNLLGNQYSGCFSNSVTNQGDSGFMLGVKDLYALRIWSWGERVKALIDGKKFLLALGTCFETYQLKGKGYLGISADPEKVKVLRNVLFLIYC